ncbi:MAG TPA: DUF1385 domain-containing protein [Ktedonobacterales bacterium]
MATANSTNSTRPTRASVSRRPTRRFNYGGQAVIEGVMMRGQRSAAVAVRAPSGNIVLHEELLAVTQSVARWPFVRGVVLLWEMLVLGSRMMMLAASIAQGQVMGQAQGQIAPGGDVPAERDTVIETDSSIRATDPRLVGTLLFSLVFAVGLFFLLPLGAVGAAQHWIGTGWLSLLAEGLLRLALLIGYLALIGRLADVQRVFEYHGAEHKAINTLEAGQPLDVAHVRQASRVHTRCGTGFLLIVVVLSIVVFALVGNPPLALRILSRVVLVPVIAALAYELMRLGAANYRFAIVRVLMAPSLALQGLTTREPDDDEIECALAALERVLARDRVTTPEVVR